MSKREQHDTMMKNQTEDDHHNKIEGVFTDRQIESSSNGPLSE